MKKSMIICVVICLCVCFAPCTACAVSTADANEPIIPSKECSMTLNYTYGGTAFAGLPALIYPVATVSADFQYTLTEDFSGTGLTVNGIGSASEWDTIRTTIESWIISKKMPPARQNVTDGAGAVRFEGLTPGLYFVMPVYFTEDKTFYYFDSALVALPALDADGLWVYDVNVASKPQVEIPPEKQKYKVVKLWRDAGNRSERPVSILVDIICNGEIVETVTLSSDNNWSYSWVAMNNGDVWRVAEQTVPDGYLMTVEERSATFTIINTIPEPPGSPETGDSSNIGLYIALMCMSGLVLIILGAAAKRKAKE